jgi:hypothetical protein
VRDRSADTRELCLGRNHTGKTSLIRALFETLGARPEGKLEQWDPNSVSLVEFSIDGKHYFALHQRGYRALFNSQKSLIMATSNFGDWARYFSRITEFNLVFSDKDSEVKPADPSCFFLPFYINQDGSWQAAWNTFSGIRRFAAPWGPILEYFTGICPPGFYQAKAERDQESKQLEEQRRETKLLARARERFDRTLPLSGPKLHAENFNREIELLTAEVSELNKQQEDLRKRAFQEQDLLTSLEQQIRLADEALASYESDAEYLRNEPIEPLICPTCHAEHGRSFFAVLNYAEDARVLRDLGIRLRRDASDANERCLATSTALGTLEQHYVRISQLLEARKGDLKFEDVVQSMGAESAAAAFESERKALEAEIDRRLGIVERLEERMKSLRSTGRTREILQCFRDFYAAGRASLALPSIEISKVRLTSRPDLSGSGGPRAILAYYAALWNTCYSNAGPYRVPIVIDSPNQQGQDSLNLPKVLKFIAKDLPLDMQLIVGLEAAADFVFDFELSLDTPYSLLLESEWESVNADIDPLLMAMHPIVSTGRQGEPNTK